MGDWEIVVAAATTNLFYDSQFGLDDPDTEWAIAGDGGSPDFTRSTAEQWIGTGSAEADLDGGSYNYLLQTPTVTATSHTLSARIQRAGGGVPTSSHIQIRFNSSTTNFQSITDIGRGWYLCVYTGTPTAGARQFGVVVKEDGMFIDAMQLESLAYRTTYCDGGQEGCVWLGTEHESQSQRSAQSRSGGRV